MSGRALALTLALAFGSFGVGAARAAARAAPASLAPATILERYELALAELREPPAVAFEYGVEQLGPQDIVQTHRIFRSGREERDETLSVDGNKLPRPSVRILRDRADRYAIARLAPRTGDYAFRYLGIARSGGATGYAFATEPFAAHRYLVREVVLDAKRFLPRLIRFRLDSGALLASGELLYAGAGPYWMPQSANVHARLADGTPAHEHIAWSGYQFPASLPQSTFEAPHRAPPAPAVFPD
ncbi:MAG: hypothetical protein ACREM2_11410 [Vulcanimicrobiaceae bacterium]